MSIHETIHNKNLITTDSSKYINSLFNLSEIRKRSNFKDSDRYLRIYKPHASKTWDDFSAEQYQKGKSPNNWCPFFRFDSTKLIKSIFGTVDLDLQNMFNSYNVANTGHYGVRVYENSFGKIVSHRDDHCYNSNRATTFRQFIRDFTRDAFANTPHIEVLIPEINNCKIDFFNIVSSGSTRASKHLSDLLSLLRINNKKLADLFRTSDINQPQKDLPAALFFELNGTEPRYAYSAAGSRAASIPHQDPLRSKDGIYMALNLGSNQDDFQARDFIHPTTELADTGIFGQLDYMRQQDVKYTNVLILRMPRGLISAPRGGYRNECRGGCDDFDTSCSYTPDLETHVKRQFQVSGRTYTRQHNSNNSRAPTFSVAPLVHIVYPENMTGDFSLPGDTDVQPCHWSGAPSNKQEWMFDLDYDAMQVDNSHEAAKFRSTPFFNTDGWGSKVIDYLEAKDPIINSAQTVNAPPRTVKHQSNVSDKVENNAASHFHGGSMPASTPCGSFDDMHHKPLFAWITHNTIYEDGKHSAIEDAGETPWLSVGSPITRPVPNESLVGSLVGKRPSHCSPQSQSTPAWEFLCSSTGLNPELMYTKNIKKSLLDYEVTTDEAERGKGKIYIDHDDIAYCPISGSALVCDTFLPGARTSYYSKVCLKLSS